MLDRPWLVALAALALGACGDKDPPAPKSIDLAAAGKAGRKDPPAPPEPSDVATTPPEADPEPTPETDPTPDPLTRARIDSACNDAMMLMSAVEMYLVSKGGGCPKDLQALVDEGLIAKLSDDPWGQAFRLQCPTLEVRSSGPDERPDTDDDIVVTETSRCTII